MNIVRDFHPKIYMSLQIPEQKISKKQLSGLLWTYIQKNKLQKKEDTLVYIQLDKTLGELLESPGQRIYMYKGTKKVNDWWDIVTAVYKKWKS